MQRIAIEVVIADALDFECDVLALKYAQALYGVDLAVATLLAGQDQDFENRLPKENGFKVFAADGRVSARRVIFVGVKPLRQFGYQEIREFARKVLVSLAGELPETRHVCVTLHGAGYGLDEVEAFEAEIGGLVEAISGGDFPRRLSRITVAERNSGRAKRLQSVLDRLIVNGRIEVNARGSISSLETAPAKRLQTAGYASACKPHIFVAMPFAKSMDDIFHYGIQGAVNSAGFLCERADLSSFTGDVMQWVRTRIETAGLLIADLSTANPNVYLEVGYAWGCGVRTILLVRDTTKLKFDVRGQRCLKYTSIKSLEESLRNELQVLALSGESDQN